MADVGWRDWITVFILFFVNLLNYMDRYTVPAVLADTNGPCSGLQSYFSIGDAESGLVQTVFVIVYMVAAPLFGYLGDRYNRRFILAFGVAVWSTAVLASSFAEKDMFWFFMLMRGVIGIGEAAYATVGPTIIVDLFAGELRARMLMCFYFATPVGAGLGYSVGGVVAAATGHWYWGMRVTPLFGYLSVLLILIVLKVPDRGEADLKETASEAVVSLRAQQQTVELRRTSWLVDLRQLLKIKSYIFVAWAQVCMSFVTGALAFWGPVFTTRSQTVYLIHSSQNAIAPELTRDAIGQITLIMGVLISLSGFAGVTIGTLSARHWHKRNRRAEPLVCGWGMILSAPCFHLALQLSLMHIAAAYAFMFLANLGLSLNWALVSNIIMSTTIPQRRSTANAMQILLQHLLGDAISPSVIGKISDAIAQGSTRDMATYQSLQQAMFLGEFIAVLGGFFFLVSSWYVVRDRANVERFLRGLVDELGRSMAKPEALNGNSHGVDDVACAPPPYSSTTDILAAVNDENDDDDVLVPETGFRNTATTETGANNEDESQAGFTNLRL